MKGRQDVDEEGGMHDEGYAKREGERGRRPLRAGGSKSALKNGDHDCCIGSKVVFTDEKKIWLLPINDVFGGKG